jgi:hypothetical protein
MRRYKLNEVIVFSNNEVTSEVGKIVHVLLEPIKNEFKTSDILKKIISDNNPNLQENINNINMEIPLPKVIPPSFIEEKVGDYIVECNVGKPLSELKCSLMWPLDETKLYCVIFENQIEKI